MKMKKEREREWEKEKKFDLLAKEMHYTAFFSSGLNQIKSDIWPIL